MRLDYMSHRPPARGVARVIIAGGVSILCGIVATLCGIRTARLLTADQSDSFCATCAAEQLAQLGPTPEQTIPIGLLSGGACVATLVQAVRSAHGIRLRGCVRD